MSKGLVTATRRPMLRRLWTILRAHWGYWRYGRAERRARRVVVARPSSAVYDTENALFPSGLPAGYIMSAAQFVASSGPKFVPYASCARLTSASIGRSISLSELDAQRRRNDPRLSRDRFNSGRNTA